MRLDQLCFAGILALTRCGGTFVDGSDGGDARDSAAGDNSTDSPGTDSPGTDSGIDNDSSGVSSVKDVPGLALWLDGTTGITQNAMRVSGWADRSGNGNHTAQTSALMQPTYLAKGINGQPCIHFDGLAQEGQMLVAVDATTLQFGIGDFVVEVVARYDNATSAMPSLTRVGRPLLQGRVHERKRGCLVVRQHAAAFQRLHSGHGEALGCNVELVAVNRHEHE
jgi:hypothetical protein